MATNDCSTETIRSRALLSVRRLFTDWSDPIQQESVIDYRWYMPVRGWVVRNNLSGTVISTIKGLHTGVFALIMGFIVFFAYSGVRGQVSQWTLITLILTVIEALVLMVNRGRCPLTVVVEDLGAEHGSVSDIYLPDIVARHIPHISISLLGIGLAGLLARTVVRLRCR